MDILKMIQQNDMLKVVLILGAVYWFMKNYHMEKLDNVDAVSQPPLIQASMGMVQVPTVASTVAPTVASMQQAQVDKIVAGPTQLTTQDLLPAYDDANEFAKQNPVSKLLQEQNFLTAGHHMGINTVVQSNKIPYLDLRSCPPIPKQEVSPFNNSSFETPVGSGRRHFELA